MKHIIWNVLAVLAAAALAYYAFTTPRKALAPEEEGKLNINAVCSGALAYTTFPDGAAADAFIADCVAGKHPEVIERYKANLNLGTGATI